MNDDSRHPDSRQTEGAADAGHEPLRVGGYELLREIGHGGQATIFVATQLSTGRKVAVKFMYGGRVSSSVERSRMDQEVRILAALDHPNIVSVIDRGETPDGSVYFVMPYVHGKMLNEFMDEYHQQHGRPEELRDLRPILQLFARICSTINAAHLRGIVHRDLKSTNIIIDSYGEPHVLDFGMARGPLPNLSPDGSSRQDTQTGEFLGSAQWASPEQAESRTTVDIRSDVYSLGVLLYEMLTGEFPYDVFGSLREVLNHIVGTEPRPPSAVMRENWVDQHKDNAGPAPAFQCPIDDVLDIIVLKSLAKKPEDRFQSAGEFAKAVSFFLGSYGETPVRSLPRAEKPALASPKKRIAAVFAGLLLLGATIFSVLQLAGRSEKAAMDPDAVGYRPEEDNVVFTFFPEEFDQVRLADGRMDRLSSMGSVRKVMVAGPFNSWGESPGDWFLKKEEDGSFRLSVPIKVFASRHVWPFKFVVNGNTWVGGPPHAANRELVLTDTATYNLLLYNPAVKPDEKTQQIKVLRETINQAWPGQGANLSADSASGYHYTFTYVPSSLRITDLDPLRGIPLVSLDLGDTKVTDFGSLQEMKSLATLVMSDSTYYFVISEIRDAMVAGDYDRALQNMDVVFGPYRQVPALAAAEQLIAGGIACMTALRDEPGAVPAGAIADAGHRFAYIPLPMTWFEARDYAAAAGGYLATITSEKENDWMVKAFGKPSLGRRMWLGGTDERAEGFWRWTNDERWRYDNWNKPDPDNVDNAEHHLAMKFDGWWVDFNGNTHRYPFVIEWNNGGFLPP